jgi:hypothetical protein
MFSYFSLFAPPFSASGSFAHCDPACSGIRSYIATILSSFQTSIFVVDQAQRFHGNDAVKRSPKGNKFSSFRDFEK